MKKAIAYIRISDKDQSNFSLDGQEKYIRDFCEKQQFVLLNIFRDEGKSAKNFDRPDWKELESFCQKNHKDVDILVVVKYDRFSRNLSESLRMIELLENKFKIRILSVMEPIMLPAESPFFFQFRTQMLMGAQVEWMVIRDRTKFGNHHAAKAGRFIHTAPYGYINKRDDQNKPIIVIDEVKAPLIKKAYSMILEGAPINEVYLEAKKNGYGNRGHSAMKRTLTNPVYAGMILAPEYQENPETLVKGLHEPIIDAATWYKVQDVLNPRKITRTVLNEDVPLRGVLKCFCGRCFTAGNSKGKKNYYWYYKCDQHPKNNLSAKKLHEQFNELLKELSLPVPYITTLKEMIEEEIHIQHSEKEVQILAKKRELLDLTKKIDRLEEKYLDDALDKDTYKKWKDRYIKESAICQQYISDFNLPLATIWGLYKENLPKLENLHWLYEKADLHQKQTFIRQVFKSSLYYHGEVYRTPYLLPMFLLKAATVKEKRLLIVEQPLENFAKFPARAPGGS